MHDVSLLLATDRARVWHPYANTTAPGPLYAVKEARGTHLLLDDGTRQYDVIDAMASWWCQIHGYRHPHLDAALHSQIDRFSHVMFGGLTHEPAVTLCQRLGELTQDRLSRVFLADSGSVAMEVSLKIARQWAQAAHPGSNRTKVAALSGAYHGDTLGAMSICDPQTSMHAAWAGVVPNNIFLPRPPAFDADEASITAWADQTKSIIHEHRDQLAGIVVEPILQGAGGMWFWSPAALRILRELADSYQLLLIADEIATGLGRTGTLFGCDHANIVPDILVLGKSLTGGYLTQAAVLCRDAIATTIGTGTFGALMHGPTFMANPLACAASLASLELLDSGAWRTAVPRIASRLLPALADLNDDPRVASIRGLGGAVAVELHTPVTMAVATQAAIDAGVWLRPFGKLVYTLPPYICSDEELDQIAAGIHAVVAHHQEPR
ncbi:MAG: adenosylmethionine--8-amino-7-oxononanoate transaminase [Propionibacteriaceae bacterium]